MKAKKKVIDHIEKCYAVTEMEYEGKRHLICAAEANGPCRSYDMDGNIEETLWEGPGGVMTLVQYPNERTPILLATQKFYSPDNSSDAKLVYYYRDHEEWICKTLCELPHVHRFGIVWDEKNRYIVAATLKSANAYDGDWTCPGRLWVSELPQNIMQYDNEHQLKFTPLLSGLYKNHGFCIHQGRKIQYAVVGSENGVYMVVPPNSGDSSWKCEHIFDKPVSDMLYRDFDHDGENELLVITPFHGENIQIYKSSNGKMLKIYERKKKMPFAHAIWGDTINGDEYAFIGGRNGDRELVSIHYDRDTEQYIEEVIDVGAGAANCMMYKVDGEKRLLVANRETDEVGIYEW